MIFNIKRYNFKDYSTITLINTNDDYYDASRKLSGHILKAIKEQEDISNKRYKDSDIQVYINNQDYTIVYKHNPKKENKPLRQVNLKPNITFNKVKVLFYE